MKVQFWGPREMTMKRDADTCHQCDLSRWRPRHRACDEDSLRFATMGAPSVVCAEAKFTVLCVWQLMERRGRGRRMASRAVASVGFFFALLLLADFCSVEAGEDFDVRQHISSTTSYAAGKSIKYGNEKVESTPDGCVPVHVNLVARHGSRRPTKKRIKELEDFAERLRVLSKEAEKAQTKSTSLPPAWINDWKSPWSDKQIGGELLPKGEEELYDLAQRYKIKYPEIFSDQYHPDVYPIIATQVGRSSASSVAFGMGMFAGQGTLGAGKQRAFSVVTDSKGHDIHLRFHDTCMAYKESKKLRKPKVAGWQGQVYDLVAKGVKGRYGLAVTGDDVTSLWLLCKNEASLLDVVDQSCGLFTPEEVELLEWADDLQMHHLKGYGETLNYRMGAPLLDDVVKSMDRAMVADQSNKLVEKARLRFAHAETVIPFSCLLGLFLEGTDIEQVQSEEPLDAPIRPPHNRLWRAALVAPFAANTALVLHKCPADNGAGVKYFVQALHNEKPVIMPACNGTYFCPIEAFKERVVAPHMKRSYESLCTMQVVHKPANQTFFQRFFSIPSHLFRWLFKSSAPGQGVHHSEL